MKRWPWPVLLTFVFPGLGQLYNRSWLKGILVLASTAWLSGRLTTEAVGTLSAETLAEPLPDVPLWRLLGYLLAMLALFAWALRDARRGRAAS